MINIKKVLKVQTDNPKIRVTIHRSSYKLLIITNSVEAPYHTSDLNILSQAFVANTPHPKLDNNRIIRCFMNTTLQELFYCCTPYHKNDYVKCESLLIHHGLNLENIVR
jgi:hypothetical protein